MLHIVSSLYYPRAFNEIRSSQEENIRDYRVSCAKLMYAVIYVVAIVQVPPRRSSVVGVVLKEELLTSRAEQ